MQWKKSNAKENEYKISLRKMLQPSNTYSSSSSSSTNSGSSTMPINSSMKMEEKQTLINKSDTKYTPLKKALNDIKENDDFSMV